MTEQDYLKSEERLQRLQDLEGAIENFQIAIQNKISRQAYRRALRYAAKDLEHAGYVNGETNGSNRAMLLERERIIKLIQDEIEDSSYSDRMLNDIIERINS